MSGGASAGICTDFIISCAPMTWGLLRTVVAKPADRDGLILLVVSRACHRGSGGPSGAAGRLVVALAATSPPPAAAAPAVAGWLAQGAGPSTSLVSNLITS